MSSGVERSRLFHSRMSSEKETRDGVMLVSMERVGNVVVLVASQGNRDESGAIFRDRSGARLFSRMLTRRMFITVHSVLERPSLVSLSGTPFVPLLHGAHRAHRFVERNVAVASIEYPRSHAFEVGHLFIDAQN